MHLVSVIIPVYNSAEYLRATLQSVVDQEYSPLEIIVVDDGSTDRSVRIASEFKVQIFTQPNRGACAARNLGIRKACGDYLQFLDADDLISPDKIRVQVERLSECPGAIANGRWGRFYSLDPWTETIDWEPHPSLREDLSPVDWLIRQQSSQTGCWLVPAQLIEKAGYWDESLSIYQDGEFFSRIVGGSDRVLYTPEARTYYRSGVSGSISTMSRTEKAVRCLFRTYQSFEQVLLGLEESDRTRQAVADVYQLFLYRTYPIDRELTRKAEEKVRSYGGSQVKPYRKGKMYNLILDLMGWKFALRVDWYWRKVSYEKG